MSGSSVGFLLSGDSFVWTKRGLLKVKESREGDELLGLNRETQQVTFEPLQSSLRKLSDARLVRITTDLNEIMIPRRSQIYTINGKTSASQVHEEDYLDVFSRMSAFDELRGLYNSNERKTLTLKSGRTVIISEDLAYLLGTQAILGPWNERATHKIVLDIGNPDNCRKICKVFRRALKSAGIPHTIYMTRMWRRIIIMDDTFRQEILDMILQIFSQQQSGAISIDPSIRMAPTDVIHAFAEGLLDSRASLSRGGRLKFYTLAHDSEIRRFIYCLLALFGIRPIYTFVRKPEWGLKAVTTYLALPKNHSFELKALALKSKEILAEKSKSDLQVYAKVRHVAFFKGTQFILPVPREHWNLIVDLVPVHHQKIKA